MDNLSKKERKSTFSKKELIEVGLGKLFGMDRGKLPMPPMLMVDRILQISDKGGKYKKGEINIDTLMNDIDSLSVMEEVYEARKIIEDANAGDPKYVSGSGYGFFENHVVLSVPNKPIN